MAESREQVLARIDQVKQDAAQRLLAIPDVVAVGIGPKTVAGEPTGEPAIRILVRHKLPADQVPPDQLIPAEIDGIVTDVAVGGDFVKLAVKPVDTPGAIGALDTRPQPARHAHTKLPPDEHTARPVTGGVQITPVDVPGAHGTLGCLLWDPANHDVGFALTCMHVVRIHPTDTVTVGVTKTGQPTGDDSSSNCCSDVIGVFAGGGGGLVGQERDEAVIRLANGTKWKAVIDDIGPVAGAHVLTQPEVTAGNYKVAKRGRTTKVTGGVISLMSATTSFADNVLVIDPVPNPGAATGETVFFAIEGDSGSALVNEANEVVGLVDGRDDHGHGTAFTIGHVLERLKTVDGLTLEVAKATDANEEHTVPGAALMAVPPEMAAAVAADAGVFLGEGDRAPVARPWFSDLPPATPLVEQVVGDLSGSDAGRRLLDLWQLHREEITGVIQRDRRATLAWHRGGGAALTQLVLRLPVHPDRPLPATLNGEPLMAVVDRNLAFLAPRVRPPLAADLLRCRELMPDLAGLTYAEIVSAVSGTAQRV